MPIGRNQPPGALTIAILSPPFTIILVVIFPGEEFTFVDAIGTALIILASAFGPGLIPAARALAAESRVFSKPE